MEERKAPGYGNPAATSTACLLPSGEPLALQAILSVFICLSACVSLYLLMCLSLCCQMPPQLEPLLLKTGTSPHLLPEGRHAHPLAPGASPPLRKAKTAPQLHSPLQFAFLYPTHMFNYILALFLKFKALTLCLFFTVTLRGAQAQT